MQSARRGPEAESGSCAVCAAFVRGGVAVFREVPAVGRTSRPRQDCTTLMFVLVQNTNSSPGFEKHNRTSGPWRIGRNIHLVKPRARGKPLHNHGPLSGDH
ncbi:unnamed protein product [Merluccius merluccius]